MQVPSLSVLGQNIMFHARYYHHFAFRWRLIFQWYIADIIACNDPILSAPHAQWNKDVSLLYYIIQDYDKKHWLRVSQTKAGVSSKKQ